MTVVRDEDLGVLSVRPAVRRGDSLRPSADQKRPSVLNFRVVVNLDAGGLSRRKLLDLTELLRASFAVKPRAIQYVDRHSLTDALQDVAHSRPDAVLVCGGDGTARTAIEALTPLGVPVVPLPGGTLNRLVHAVYGSCQIKRIMAGLSHGAPAWIPAGVAAGRRFYVVSGYGAPMQLNAVREHVRAGRWPQAWRALSAASKGMFAPTLEVGASKEHKASCAIVALGPIDAAFGLKPLGARSAFEVASATVTGWGSALQLAPFALLGGWRERPNVNVGSAMHLRLQGDHAGIVALMDGEPFVLPSQIDITYEPRAGLVWR